MPSFRTLVFWPHLIAGVVAGSIILVMSVRGVMLTYERQMIAWSDAAYRSTPPVPEAPRLPLSTLLERVQRGGDVVPTAITVASDPSAPVVVAAAPRALLVDAYSGRVLGESGQRVRAVMSE